MAMPANDRRTIKKRKRKGYGTPFRTVNRLEIENKVQWHPAFCSAVELELRENREGLEYDREHNLGRKPLQVDLLVIKKSPGETIRNEIGTFFLGHNIMEYKSPGDALSMDTLYKVFAYACLYKAETGIPETDITVSLVREGKPLKLLGLLSQKYPAGERGNGIYHVGGMLFPVQFIVTGELDPAAHIWLRSLTRSMGHGEAERLLESYVRLEDGTDRLNAGSIVSLASDTNQTLFEQIIKGGGFMSDALKEMLNPEFARLKVLLADSKAELADKNARLADSEAKLADSEAKLADSRAEIADSRAEIAALKRQLAELQKAD